ncbi:MAG: hypothetical protein FJ399_19315 [Verrucomicrobia bacterium]|nr:hypothetical protein [Verrucomicrobiota bacterium]
MCRVGLIAGWLAACAVGLVSCASGPAPLKPRGAVAVKLDAAKKRSTVQAGLANLVTITMPPARPGFAWQISFHDSRYLKQQTDFTPPAAADAGPAISFLAINNGNTRLRFVLVPASTNLGVDPVDQQEVVFSIR